MGKKQTEQNILIFRSSGRLFSLPASMVEEIVEAGVVTPLPFLQAYVDGLVSLNGLVAVQIDFAQFIGQGSASTELEHYDLLQINNESGTYALKVEEVVENIQLKTADLRLFNMQEDELSNDVEQVSIVEGEFDWNGFTVLHIAVDPLNDVLNVVNVPSSDRAVLPKRKQQHQQLEDRHRFLIVGLHNEQFAFRLEDTVEIFETHKITPVPGAISEIMGITVIREQAILVLSSARLLKMQTQSSASNQQVLILFNFEHTRIALAFDQVLGIEDIASHQLKLNGQNKHAGVLLSSAGDLINLLNLSDLLTGNLARNIVASLPQAQQQNQRQQLETGTFLQVKSAREKYIFWCKDVMRILEYSVPDAIDESLQTQAAGKISGVTHFDGQVLPVLELSKNNKGNQNFSAYVVLKGKDNEFAVPVLEAERIIELELPNIDLYSAEDARIVSGLAKNDGELLSLVDVAFLESHYFGGVQS